MQTVQGQRSQFRPDLRITRSGLKDPRSTCERFLVLCGDLGGYSPAVLSQWQAERGAYGRTSQNLDCSLDGLGFEKWKSVDREFCLDESFCN